MIFLIAVVLIGFLVMWGKYKAVTGAPTIGGFLITLPFILLWYYSKYPIIIIILNLCGLIISSKYLFADLLDNVTKPTEPGAGEAKLVYLLFIIPIFIVFLICVVAVIYISIFLDRGILNLINKDLLRRLNSGTKNIPVAAVALRS